MFVEVTQMPGTGQLTLTGNLGDIIKESAHIARGWIRRYTFIIHCSIRDCCDSFIGCIEAFSSRFALLYDSHSVFCRFSFFLDLVS
jgi:hypothetical protein